MTSSLENMLSHFAVKGFNKFSIHHIYIKTLEGIKKLKNMQFKGMLTQTQSMQ
jgi:hypothetical protein